MEDAVGKSTDIAIRQNIFASCLVALRVSVEPGCWGLLWMLRFGRKSQWASFS